MKSPPRRVAEGDKIRKAQMSDLSPLPILLGTLGVLAFLMTLAGFVALVWRMSWGVRGFVEAEQLRAKTDVEIVRMLNDFIQAQRESNDQMWTAIQVNADRTNRALERKLAEARTDS